MDYTPHFQILIFSLIIGIGISLFLGARSYIKIALVVLLIYIPIEIYYTYKLNKALVPVVGTIPNLTIPSNIIKSAELAARNIISSQTITADGSLITLPIGGKPAINAITSNLQASNSKIGDIIADTVAGTVADTVGGTVPKTIPDYYPRKLEDGNKFAIESNMNLDNYTMDKPPFDGLDPKELVSRLNYVYYATAQPAKKINYHDFTTHADKYLNEDGTKLSNNDLKLQTYSAGYYPQLTENQIDARDCLNYGSGPGSCFQSAQLFYNKAHNFNILDKGVNMDNANLIIREDFSMPSNLEAITSRPLPLDIKDRNASILFMNAPKGNLDRPLDQESNESLGKKLDDSTALCYNCKLAVCKDDYCGLQNSLFM
jgi:hypothetical protein